MKRYLAFLVIAATLLTLIVFFLHEDTSEIAPNLVSEANPIGIDTSPYTGNFRHTNRSDLPSFGGFTVEVDSKGNSRWVGNSFFGQSADDTFTLLSIDGVSYAQLESDGAWQTTADSASYAADHYNKDDFIGQGLLDHIVEGNEYQLEYKYVGDGACNAGKCRIYELTDPQKDQKIEESEKDPDAHASFSESTLKIDIKTNRLSEQIIVYHSLPKSDPESYVETSTSIFEYGVDFDPIIAPENVIVN